MLPALKLPAIPWANRAGVEQPLSLAPSSAAPEAHLAVMPWGAFTDGADWDALAARAAEPNPFAERWCLEAGLAAVGDNSIALACLSAEETLAGIMPLARRLRYEGHPIPHLRNWLHANAFCGAPLVAAGHEHTFWRALLAWADRAPCLTEFVASSWSTSARFVAAASLMPILGTETRIRPLNAPRSCRISSAAMVSRRMRDSAKATSSGIEGDR